MAKTHVYGLFGDAHVRGNSGSDAGSSPPVVLGPAEQILFFFGSHNLVAGTDENTTIEQTIAAAATDVRARVVAIPSASTVIVEPIVPSTTALYPAQLNAERRIMWSSTDAITFNRGAPQGLRVFSYTNSQLIEQLNDDELLKPTEDSVFWDPNARLARTVSIENFDGSGSEAVYPGDKLTASSGGDFLVVGVSNVDNAAKTATLHVANWNGSIANGDTLATDHTTPNQSWTGVSIVASTGIGAAQSAGSWVPHCASPSLGFTIEQLESDTVDVTVGSMWEVPPRGNGNINSTKSTSPQLGPDTKIVRNAIRTYENLESDDQGIRLVKFGSNETTLTDTGGLGGVTLQYVSVSSPSGTYTTGEVVTSDDAVPWSAKVAGYFGSILYVHTTNGEVLGASKTITGATSGVTSTSAGAAVGWQKGSSYWNAMAAERTSAEGATGFLHNGSAAKWERIFLMVWEGEVGPYSILYGADAAAGYAMSIEMTLTSQAARRAQWTTFAADLRALLDPSGGVSMHIRTWVHHSGSQSESMTPTLGLGVVSAATRANILELPSYVTNFSVVDSEQRGHLMESGRSASYGAGDTDTDLFLRTSDYIDLGQALWDGRSNRAITAPAGNLQILPIGVISGSQSQMLGTANYNSGVSGVAYIDRDPEKYASASFLAHGNTVIDTTDSNAVVFNFQEDELETWDVNLNENTFNIAATAIGTTGPCPPIVQRMKMRYGSGGTSGLFGLFKAVVGGSCLNPDIRVATGCWQPLLTSRPSTGPVSTVVTHVNNKAVFTAAGAFSTFGSADYTVVITGGALFQGAMGRNTVLHGINIASNITSNSFEIDDASGLIENGTETLTFTFGPPPLWPTMEAKWKLFVADCIQKGYIPRPVWLLQDQGESDMLEVSSYKQYLDEFWTAFEDLCDMRESTSDSDIAKCIVQVHKYSPFGNTPIADINTIRGLQSTKSSTLANCVLVDPTPLSLEVSADSPTPNISVPPWPRRYRLENGIHLTLFAMQTKGYMIDAALGSLSSIPSHPNADVSVGYGASDGTGRLEQQA